MKKIIALFSLCAVCLAIAPAVKAQLQVGGTKTITASDTTDVVSKDGGKFLSYTFKESSGTTAGKVYLEGTFDGQKYWHIDSSLSLTDVTTAQSVKVDVSSLYYIKYRARNTNTSSATGVAYFYLITAATVNKGWKEQ